MDLCSEACMSASEKKAILLLGAGGHARACIDVIEQAGDFAIHGLVGLPEEVGKSVFGYPVLGSDADLQILLAQCPFAVVTIGQIKTAESRIRLYTALVEHRRCPPAIVSPRAYVSPHASVGAGTIVFHGAVINAGAVVGKNCIVNSLALVEHDVVVEDHCHIATGARINSGVRVGEGSFVGSGCTVRQGLIIGRNCVIGMGVSVLADCADSTQLPAKRKCS
jgi:sugar O-acyltransferase (sialic acid O-acetyltransferase NeuD family)